MKLGRAPTTKQTGCEVMSFVRFEEGSDRPHGRPPPRAYVEVALDCGANPRELGFADAGIQRKRQPFARKPLRHWEIPRAIAEVPIRRRHMWRMGVVPAGLDAPIGKMGRERLRVRA